MSFLETNKQNKDKKEPICSASLNTMMQLLHKSAQDAAYKVSKDFRILNSAVEKNGHEFKFAGAGKHVLVFYPVKDEYKVSKLVAVAKEYIHVMTGTKPSISYLSFNTITSQMTNSEEEKELKENIHYSSLADVIFSECNSRSSQESLMNMLFESSDSSTDPAYENFKTKTRDYDLQLAAKSGEKIRGYYLRFDVKTGQKFENTKPTAEQNAWTSILKTAKDILYNISVSKYDWKSGSVGEKHYLGNFIDSIIGKIDPGKLQTAVDQQLHKAPLGITMANIAVLPSASVANYLQKIITRAESDKIKTAEYVLAIKIDKRSKSYELVNVPLIADIVNKSIEKSIINKVFGVNRVTTDDVVLVNNYDDDIKDKYLNKYSRSYNNDYSSDDFKKYTPECREGIKKLTKIMLFKYFKNRIDVLADYAGDRRLQNGFTFSTPDSSTLSAIRDAPYSSNYSRIDLMIDYTNHDRSLIQNNANEIDSTLQSWTYNLSSGRYGLKNSVDRLLDPSLSAVLSAKVAPAFNIPPSSVINSRGQDIRPIVRKYRNDNINSTLSADIQDSLALISSINTNDLNSKASKNFINSGKTQYDCYLIPLQNIDYGDNKPKTLPDKMQ